jgi:hypothetical protein
MNKSFYHKYLKYKNKYLELKKQLGGEEDMRIIEMKKIYNSVKELFGENIYITGSMAIYTIVYFLNKQLDENNKIQFPDELLPNDIDILIQAKRQRELIQVKQINTFVRTNSMPQKSITLIDTSDSELIFKSFDLSLERFLHSRKYYEIEGIKVLNLESIKSFYKEDEDVAKYKQKSEMKIDLIDYLLRFSLLQIKVDEKPTLEFSNRRRREEIMELEKKRKSSKPPSMDDLFESPSKLSVSPNSKRSFNFELNLDSDSENVNKNLFQ